MQVVTERLPLAHLLRAGRGALRHERREAPDDDHRDDGAQKEVAPAADVELGEDERQHAQHDRDQEAVADPAGADGLRVRREQSCRDHFFVHLPDDGLHVGVEVVAQLLGGHLVGVRAVEEGCGYRAFEPLEVVQRLGTREDGLGATERVLALGVGHLDVAPPRQVDDGGDDLLGIDLLVDECPGQSRRKTRRRLADVAGEGLRGIVPAAAPPDEEHAQEEEDGEHKPQLGQDEGRDAAGGPRVRDHAFGEAGDYPELSVCRDVGGLVDHGGGVRRGRLVLDAIARLDRLGHLVLGHRGRELDRGPHAADGDGGLRVEHEPAQLIALVPEHDLVGGPVVEGPGA